MVKKSYIFATVLPVLLFCFAASAAANSCIECHSNEDFYARFPKLYNYYQEWIKSPHAVSGVTCDDCHGGDPRGDTAQAAHADMFPINNPKNSLYFSAQPATCGSCHHDKQTEFEQSKHFLALKSETKAAPTCTTCHPAMNKRPSYQAIVLDACTTCHESDNRQGLPDIIDKAEDLLGHVNAAHGMIGWAKLHFSSQDWPDNSRENMQLLENRYADIVDQVHRFDLEKSNESAVQLLTDLRRLFEAERRSSRAGASSTTP
jgi:hypothetical protein